MGTCYSSKSVPIDKGILVYGYCRNFEKKLDVIIPTAIKQLIDEYLSLRKVVTSTDIVSDEHIEKLSSMDIIILPRGTYNVGEHKLMIYTDERIKKNLKQFKKRKIKNKTLIIGSLGIGGGFTKLLCYKIETKSNKPTYYNENCYFEMTIGGMNGYDREQSNKSFAEGYHLNFIKLTNILDVANKIWRSKQMLMGNIPFDDSDESDDDNVNSDQ